jgi:3-hydroxyisobutyrate dehydrogenase
MHLCQFCTSAVSDAAFCVRDFFVRNLENSNKGNQDMAKVSVLGLGAMGSRVALRMVKAGHEVTVWNRTPQACDPVVAAGAVMVHTPREAAAQADVIVCMVRDDEASRTVWLDPETGALGAVLPSTVALESSTLSLHWVHSLTREFEMKGVRFLDAPVVGSRAQAEAGQLISFVGGDASVVAQSRPVLDAMSSVVLQAGPAGAGAALKLALNSFFGIQVAALAEILDLVRKAGFDPARALELFASTPACSPAAKAAAGAMLSSSFSPAFPVELVEKDLTYGLQWTRAEGASTPMIAAAHNVFSQAVSSGLSHENLTAVIKLYREKNPPTTTRKTPMKPLYTAIATNIDGREGKVVTDDEALSLSLSLPKGLGGPGTAGTTNPEQLFAAGYAACFGSTLRVVAATEKLDASKTTVMAKVSVGPDDTSFALGIELVVSDPKLNATQLRTLIDGAHRLCPYSKATRHNIEVKTSVG